MKRSPSTDLVRTLWLRLIQLMVVFVLLSVFFHFAQQRADEASQAFLKLKRQDFYTALYSFQAKWFLHPQSDWVWEGRHFDIRENGWPQPKSLLQCEQLWHMFLSEDSFKRLSQTEYQHDVCMYRLGQFTLRYDPLKQMIRTD